MNDKTKFLVGLLAVFMLATQDTTSYNSPVKESNRLALQESKNIDTTIQLFPETKRLLDSLEQIKTQVDSLKNSCTKNLIVLKRQQKAMLEKHKEIDTIISDKQIKKALKYNGWLPRN